MARPDRFGVVRIALMLLALGTWAWAPTAAPQQPQPAKTAVQTTMSTVAVWDLENLSPSSSSQPDLGQALSARIMEAFQDSGRYTVVERQQLMLALEELHLGSSELADEDTRLKLGRLVGAQGMVFGAYLAIGGSMRLDLRLVDVQTGKVLNATQKTVPASELAAWLKAAKEAAQELL